MVFKRSLSLPVPNPNPNPNPSSAASAPSKEKSYHVRSTSLPCRSHPIISTLEDEIRSLRSWQSETTSAAATASTSSSLKTGLSRLELLHGALDGLLQLPQTQESLRRRRRTPYADRLLDDFLRLADAYGCFRESLVALQQLQVEAQVAARRRDEARLSSYVKAQKKVEKEVARLVGVLRDVSKSQEISGLLPSTEQGAGEVAELMLMLREVRLVWASVSASVLSGLVAQMGAALLVASGNPSAASSAWGVLRRRLQAAPKKSKRNEEEWERSLEGLKGLEKCVVGLERGCERVYRCLINTRVSLLNILTP